jgi:hypothetical protein
VSFAKLTTVESPAVPTGAQWNFQVAVKAFEANTVPLLEAAINNWLLTLRNSPLEHSVLAVNYQSGAKERALVTYGAFINVTT